MSRDVLNVSSTMRIPLLSRGEYSQWVERFMNYLEEQTEVEAMLNSIKNGDQPLPRVTQLSIAGTSSTEQPPLKDKSMCNKTTKDLWDALARHMLGSEYGEQDRKAAVLYEYETFKATEGEYNKTAKDLWDALARHMLGSEYGEQDRKAAILSVAIQKIINQGDVNDAMGSKKKTVVVTSDPLALIAEKTNVSKSKEKVVVSSESEGSEADDFRNGFENLSYFEKAKDLRPTLYDEMVIGLGYTSMFLTHYDEALEIEKSKRSRENKIEFAYDYGNLNASYVNEKINFEDDYFQDIINPNFENIDSPFQQTSSFKPYVPNMILEKIIIDLEDEVLNILKKEKVNLETIESLKSKSFESSEKVSFESKYQSKNDCYVVEKEYDKEENPKVIAPGMFKLNVSQYVSPISMSKLSCDSNNVENTFSSVR
nr:hypothetical protein [Tanacetum cinerariifolium]